MSEIDEFIKKAIVFYETHRPSDDFWEGLQVLKQKEIWYAPQTNEIYEMNKSSSHRPYYSPWGFKRYYIGDL